MASGNSLSRASFCKKKRNCLCFLLPIILLLTVNFSIAQNAQKDIKDVIKQWRNDTLVTSASQTSIGQIYYSVLPVIGYGPSYGFLAGGAFSFTKLFGAAPTKASSALLNFQYTTNEQFIMNARSKIYLNNNKWFFQGDWRLLFYAQPTYGLGISQSKALTNSGTDDGELITYDHIRVYEDVALKLGNSNFYAGVGIAIDQHFNIIDELLNLSRKNEAYFVTSHFDYSAQNKFNFKKYGTNGIKLTVLTDTRDNISNTYKGYFFSVSLLNNLKIGNNSKQSTQMLYDARYYLNLNTNHPRDVLALWSWGSFILQGKIPYLALPSIGWDTYNRSGRGYIQGRYRGLNMLYNEAEYRFQLSKNNLFGGVVFVNSTNASSYDQQLLDKWAIGYGIGLRLQMDKLNRTNLSVDLGMSPDHFGGIYFNLQESF